MNRAWIPAGALAGVSVAGLIALGPLTSSLTSKPSFSSVMTVPVPKTSPKAVPVDYTLKRAVGKVRTETAALNVRGGQAAGQNGDTGPVALQIKKPAPQTSRVTAPSTPAPTPTAKPTKKSAKRPASIGATSGPNGDAGLAGSNPNGPTRRGEQQSTPASDTP
jgi:hypothetical protein